MTATVTNFTGNYSIGFFLRDEASDAWSLRSTVREDFTGASANLDNGYTHQLDSGNIVVAYRYHLYNGQTWTYRLQTSISSDAGVTWSQQSNITQGPIGVWEPYLYDWQYPNGTKALRVLYSAELTNGGEQDIVQQESLDGGYSWGAVNSRVHTPGSRNGMAGVVTLPDGSLFMVFEGFWNGPWGQYTVNGVRSFDGGLTWVQRSIVFAGANNTGQVASAPKVGFCEASNAVVVTYMTNIPIGAAQDDHQQQSKMPQMSSSSLRGPLVNQIQFVVTRYNVNDPSAPLNWTDAPRAELPMYDTGGLFPFIVMDTRASSGGAGSGPSTLEDGMAPAPLAMRVTYESADNTAVMTDGDMCTQAAQMLGMK